MHADDARFSPACERNKAPILETITPLLRDVKRVVEVGSGTGQHAAWFAPRLPHLTWQPTDLVDNHPSIRSWAAESGASNLLPPRVVDLLDPASEIPPCDAIYSANVVHIVRWEGVEGLIDKAGRALAPGGMLLLYGPYRYADRPFEPSNAAFDASLRSRGVGSGIRDFDAVNELALAAGLMLVDDYAMPANNRLLHFERHP